MRAARLISVCSFATSRGTLEKGEYDINIQLYGGSSRSGDATDDNAAGILSRFSVITTSHLAVLKRLAVVQMVGNKCPPHAAMLMSFPGLCAQPVSIFRCPTRRGHSPLSPAHDWITVLMRLIHRTARVSDTGST